MTLIATAISNVGIVMASDSNLTSATSKYAGEGRKLFHVPAVGGALAVAGTYSIGAESMDQWMPAVIDSYGFRTAPTLGGFADYLAGHLSAEIAPDEFQHGTLVHIAAYVEADSEAHPEFWFVRNIAKIDETTGDYIGSDHFDVSEDFWHRDYLNPGVQRALEFGSEQRYFNGYPPGRIAYLEFIRRFGLFLKDAWSQPTWNFRAPQTVDELARFVDLEIRAIGAMFYSSDYSAPFIGGTVQLETIPPPSNALKLGLGAATARYGQAAP